MSVVIDGTAGVTTPAIDAASGNADLTTLSVAGNEISAVNSLGFRNRIINGGMVIDQRNAGASVTMSAAIVYTVDRWWTFEDTDGTMTAQQSSTAPTGFTNSLLCTTTVADASLGATQRVVIGQSIEGFNVADLGWGTASAQTVTLSFWVRSSLTGTFGGAAKNQSSTRSYPFTYTISAANTWEQKTVTIAGDTTGTWLTNNSTGMQLNFALGVGSTFSGTAGAWAGADLNSATGAVSVVGTSGATFYITGVQLEAGSVASPFERRDYGRELMMCQRYYQIWFAGWAGVAQSSGYNYTSGVSFGNNMRASPTMGVSSQTNSARFPSANYFVNTSSQYGASLGYTAASSGGNDVWTVTGTASAEL